MPRFHEDLMGSGTPHQADGKLVNKAALDLGDIRVGMYLDLPSTQMMDHIPIILG